MPLQNMPLRYINYLELWEVEKQQIQGEAFSESPYLSKDRSSIRKLVVINSHPREFLRPGKMDLPQRRGY